MANCTAKLKVNVEMAAFSSMLVYKNSLPDEQATIALGRRLAQGVALHQVPLVFHLQGELGAGKSTLARALLRALGVKGAIKSPTYALVEPYDTPLGSLLHLDLYRLGEPSELEYLGLDALLGDCRVCLIEWAQRAAERLPNPDVLIELTYVETAPGRHVRITALSESGTKYLDSCQIS
jgi:tRNA threonylcarbamoyladenosine biosynthesis protein TsaE